MRTIPNINAVFKPTPVGFWGQFKKFWTSLNVIQKVLITPIAIILAPITLLVVGIVSLGLFLFTLR